MTDKALPTKKRARKAAAYPKIEPQAGAKAPAASPIASAAKPESKIENVIALLQHENGATLDDMVAATGWQPHTTRAALTGLKKKGYLVASQKKDGVRRYRADNPQ